MSHQLFRFGKSLLIGETKNMGPGELLHLEVQFQVLENGLGEVRPELVKVPTSFVINASVNLSSAKFVVSEQATATFAGIVHENVMPYVIHNNSDLVAYERTRRGLGFLSEGEDVSWVAFPDVMTTPFAQTVTLEALKPSLTGLGLLEQSLKDEVSETITVLSRPVHVYMKEKPFRDITKLKEGTAVTVTGYEQGCAVVEADGEPFWRPIEEGRYYDQERKDDWYYFSLDSNQDGIQDPLQSLPSKPALAGPAVPDTNWNMQPFQPRVAGHFSPAPSIANEDYGILGESGLGGVHFFFDFERLGKPKIHDVGAEPPKDPATDSHGRAIDKHMDDWVGLMVKDKRSTDKSATPQDYSGEYDHDAVRANDNTGAHPDKAPDQRGTPPKPRPRAGDETTPPRGRARYMEALMQEIMAGVDLDEVFRRLSDPSVQQEAYREELGKVFPGVNELLQV